MKNAGVIYVLVWSSLLFHHPVCAQQECDREVGGQIVEEIWSAPVICVTNNLDIGNLTITPDAGGVTVLLKGNFTIRVQGIIRAIGTEAKPIVFKPAPGNTNGWQGFYLENTGPGSEFEHCEIEGAKNSGFRLLRSTPLIRNCAIKNNTGSYGGAVYAEIPGRTLTLSNCVFWNNRAVNDGGAIWCRSSTGCLEVASCVFTQNKANYQYQTRNSVGGAIALSGNGKLVSSRFLNNAAHAYTIYAGSGIYVRGGAVHTSGGGSHEVVACEFLDNGCHMTAHGQTPDPSYPQGGALFVYSGECFVSNTLFAKNSLSAQQGQTRRGSAVYLRQGTLRMINSTLANNNAASAVYNESGTLSISSSILYFNNSSGVQISGVASVNYSDVQGGYPGTGNIDYNPVFDAGYRIARVSLAIDGGNPDAAYNDVIPPGLGTERSDMGYLGGPGGALWLSAPSSDPQEIFRVELGTVVFWIDRADFQLEHAVELSGPWYLYSGPTVDLGGRRAVLVDSIEPRKFFRLVRP